MLSIGAFPLADSHGTNRACQSSATASVSSGTDTDIPYKPLSSTSRSQSQPGSVSSEAQTTTTESANGIVSPGVVSVASHTSSTMLSGVSSSAPETQLSRTPTSLVPLINERGLPSGYVLAYFRLSCWLKQDLFHELARWAPSKNVEGLFFFRTETQSIFRFA